MTTSSASALPLPDPDRSPVFTARCPEDVLAIAPVLIGFHPAESIVMLTFGNERNFHGRIDLPPRDPDRAASRLQLDAVAGALVAPAVQHRVRKVIVLIYTEDERWGDLAWRRVRRELRTHDIHVIDANRVTDRRYHPYLARDRALRERGIAYDVSNHPFVAEAVVAGAVVHESREALAKTVVPDPEAQRRVARIVQLLFPDGGLPVTHAEILTDGHRAERLVRKHVAAGTAPSDSEVAWLCWSMQHVRVRDAAWSVMTAATAVANIDFWRTVVRRVPGDLSAAALTLLGWAAWRSGNGALAWVAVERCQTIDPGYSLAGLLAELLDGAAPPDFALEDFDWSVGLSAMPLDVRGLPQADGRQ